MHIKRISRKHTLSLAITLVLASGMGQALAAGICVTGDTDADNGGGDTTLNCTTGAADLTGGVLTGTTSLTDGAGTTITGGTVTTNNIITGAGTISGTEIDGTITSANISANTITADDIAAGAVKNSELDTNAVTADKIDAGAVDTSELATDAVTTDKIQDSAVTVDKIADNSVGNSEMLDNAIGFAEMQDNAISNLEMRDDAIGNLEMQDDAIGNPEMQDNAIGNLEMQDNAIGNAEMLDDAIGTAEIIDDSIISIDIKNDTITSDDIGILKDIRVMDGNTDMKVDSDGFDLDVGIDDSITMTATDTGITDDHSDLILTGTSATLSFTDMSPAQTNSVTVDADSVDIVGGTGTTNVNIGDDLVITTDSMDVTAAAGGDVTLNVSGAGTASMTDGTATVSTTGGTAKMDSGATEVSVDGTTARITDGDAIVSTSGDVATMSSSTGGSVTVNDTGDATMSSVEGATASTVDDAASLKSADGRAVITADNTKASVTVDNGTATHGLEIDVVPGETTLSGGTNSTTLKLNDSGADLNNRLDMGGNKINNLSAGVAPLDAVNVSQLDRVEDHLLDYAAKAAATAMAMDVFLPDPGKKFRVNVGGGFYDSESAVGITGAGRVTENVALYFGVAADVDGDEVGAKVGMSYQW